MQQFNINDLHPHPQNNYFFDDMTGEKWSEFLESVKMRGVIEPIVITSDKTIVSGHQRVRACKQLGINEITCEVRVYDNEDQILQDLLETNVRQRGDVGGSQLKLGRRIVELERIYGIKKGNNQYKEDSTNGVVLSQNELLDKLGLDRETYRRAKKLTTLPSEFQEMIEKQTIKPSTASRLISRLSSDEQKDLLNLLAKSSDVFISYNAMQDYIAEVQSMRSLIELVPELEEVKYTGMFTKDIVSAIIKVMSGEEQIGILEDMDSNVKDAVKRRIDDLVAADSSALSYEELQAQNKLLELANENLKSINRNEEELLESYKADADNYKKLQEKAVSLELTEGQGVNLIRNIENLYQFKKDIKETLTQKLAPLRYEKYLDIVKENNEMRAVFIEIIDTVTDWCLDMADLIGYSGDKNDDYIVNTEDK